MKKADLILIAGVLIAAGILALVFFLKPAVAGDAAVVEIDGVETAAYPLTEERCETIETPYGKNILVIKDGSASVQDADCPDRVCAKHRAISMAGEQIVCLPHRLVVRIVGAEAPSGVDALAQ
ncbi:MAG: NusG domain II-containing protein [Clostridia bacterium]|nr:NusG domain II-containing protein [Clostridia bacterium]MBR0537378.1 NusG domain II-containing protein [Clostridia bacterium]